MAGEKFALANQKGIILIGGVNMEDLIYLNAFRQEIGIGAGAIYRLLNSFKSPKEAWYAPVAELTNCLGQGKSLDAVRKVIKSVDPATEWEKLIRSGFSATSPGRPDYPVNLAETYLPPWILYFRGDLTDSDLSIAIVGARSGTPYGRTVASCIARDIVQAGFTVVSGFARGIDTAAHKGALEGGGKTFAVFGSGLDVIYPRENRNLLPMVLENGAVISEYPLGTAPLAINFPARNRIISGICLGTLVVEGREKSGSLITADFALEQGRDVFAIPGPINSEFSRGPHQLIKLGAKLVEQASDIIIEYAHLGSKEVQVKFAEFDLPCEDRAILEILSQEPQHIDSICGLLNHKPQILTAILLKLELSGHVRQLNGGFYVKNFL